jgi:hypothetical protein
MILIGRSVSKRPSIATECATVVTNRAELIQGSGRLIRWIAELGRARETCETPDCDGEKPGLLRSSGTHRTPRIPGATTGVDCPQTGTLQTRKSPGSSREKPGLFAVNTANGGGGTRTPKGLRPPHFECGALPIRLRLHNTFPTSVGTAGFEPATPRSRSECSTGLSHVPSTAFPTERTGWDSNPRGLLTPHDFQSCSLSRSDTGPRRSGEGGIRTRVCLLGRTV